MPLSDPLVCICALLLWSCSLMMHPVSTLSVNGLFTFVQQHVSLTCTTECSWINPYAMAAGKICFLIFFFGLEWRFLNWITVWTSACFCCFCFQLWCVWVMFRTVLVQKFQNPLQWPTSYDLGTQKGYFVFHLVTFWSKCCVFQIVLKFAVLILESGLSFADSHKYKTWTNLVTVRPSIYRLF